MTFVTEYHAMIEDVLRVSGMNDKMVHVHVGLAIYVFGKFALRTRRASSAALAMVWSAEIANEMMDFLYCGSWHWPDTLSDILFTVFWPTVDYGVMRYRRARWAADQARMEKIRQSFRNWKLAIQARLSDTLPT